MSDPIPLKPEDNVFPANFRAMNEFCRFIAVGGDVGVSLPKLNAEGDEFVVFKHLDRGARFQVIRIDDEAFIVRRLKDE